LRRCRCHLPLRRNCRSVAIGSNPIFAVLQPISVLVTSSLCIRKDVSSISVLICDGNGSSYGTEERQRNGGNQAYKRRCRRHRQSSSSRSHAARAVASLHHGPVGWPVSRGWQEQICSTDSVSLWSWSVQRARGRPGRRLQSLPSERPDARPTWQCRALCAGVP